MSFLKGKHCEKVYSQWQKYQKRYSINSVTPLFFAGASLYCYGLRNSINDLDVLIPKVHFKKLLIATKQKPIEILGDLGLVFGELEVWQTILKLDYKFWKHNALVYRDILIISPFMQLLMLSLLTATAPQWKKSKRERDFKNLLEFIIRRNYSGS